MASNNKLNEKDFILATAFVDDELNEDERLTLVKMREQHVLLSNFIQSEKNIKEVLSQKLTRIKAPQTLKDRVKEKLEQELLERDTNAIPILEAQKNTPSDTNNLKPKVSGSNANSSGSHRNKNTFKKLFPYLAIAASLLIIISIGYLSTKNEGSNSASLESYTFKHFSEHAQLINKNARIADIKNAEQLIRKRVNQSMVVPKLSSTNFKGVEMIEFISGYKTPVLVYSQPDINEFIYIFTFDLNKFPKSKLKRNKQAIKNCIKHNDYFVENVNGKHVVSWKWNNIWYSAISNHDGNKLAALVEPLNQ